MGSKRNVDMSANEDKVTEEAATEKVAAEKAVAADSEVVDDKDNFTETETDASDTTTAKSKRSGRSHRYTAARAQVDKTKLYDAFAAFELIKRLSYSSFAGTVTADALVRDAGTQVNVTFPHSTGKTLRVAIVDDAVLANIEAGKIDFDILVAEPRMVPKIARFAKLLGPRGLMPNPKNGTVTPNPEAKKKELESGMLTLRGEKKQPVMHVVIGKTSMETKELVENLQALIDALGTKLLKLTISATMSPGVKVKVG